MEKQDKFLEEKFESIRASLNLNKRINGRMTKSK
jgi:hypothetical protein